MNTLQKINDEALISTTKRLVAEERIKTLEVIEYLQAIYDRRLHLKRGYASMHAFLVQELSYSDGAAHRRIAAMRLVQELPQVKKSISDGKLSLTTASTAQVFFRSEQQKRQRTYTKEEKLALLTKLAGTTKQGCELELAKISPAYAATKQNEIKIPHDAELAQLMAEYRKLAMLSDGTTLSVLKSALKTAIESLKGKQEKRVLRQVRQAREVSQSVTGPSHKNFRLASPAKKALPVNTKHSRYIPQAIKQAVWEKNQGRCSYIDLKTKLRCGARHRLHIDHILPFALDGQTTISNLRLLCQAHNTMLAMQTYGETKVRAGVKNEYQSPSRALTITHIFEAML